MDGLINADLVSALRERKPEAWDRPGDLITPQTVVITSADGAGYYVSGTMDEIRKLLEGEG